ncbi:hypothetical protein CHU92_11395 [Flavobacterium cyanobacteriorum]|uniref:Pentapeptide repeat-containing protein n=1 Tax=Flavobacterium cyanobacteriorum TaxID=2022802 RepID=A0A255YZY3_9FLAO|nr:hypothetical protein [Flavobacterium cyanobacteriorum]OYQ34731.1 hypothetical protein CHU92_11395 [Flavobacterium cyanobacteriorum]
MKNSVIDEQGFKELINNPDNDSAKKYTIDYGLFKTFENYEIYDTKFEYGELYEKNVVIDRCLFNKVDIDGAEFKEMLWFKNCTFQGDFTIKEGSMRSLMFINCEFIEGITIYNAKVVDNFSINNCNAKYPILIKGGIYKNFTYYALNEKTHLKISGAFTFIEHFKLKWFKLIC